MIEKTYSRRSLFGFAATVAALPLLQACAGSTTTGPDLSKAMAVVSAISGTVGPLIASLGSVTGVTATTLARWQTDAAQVTTVANSLLGVTSVAQGQPIAQAFSSVVTTLINDLAGSTGALPPQAMQIIQDIQTVLPTALAVFQVVMAFAAKLGGADVDQALLNLQAFAASHR